MARGGTVFISTDPQNNQPIGIPGEGVFIGTPGPTIYGRGSGAVDAGSMFIDFTGDFQIDHTTLDVQVS
jgi:hypothetical protein